MSDFGSLIFYISVFLSSSFFISKWDIKNKWIYLVIGVAIPIYVAAIRYAVGTDFFTYMNHFLRTCSTTALTDSDWWSGEGGFALLNWIAYQFGDYSILLGLAAAAVVIPAAFAIKHDYRNLSVGLIWLLFLMTIYLTSYNIMRQMIAASFVLFSFRYITERKLLPFALSILVAILFHTSAIVFAPCYFLYSTKPGLSFKQAIFAIIILAIILNMSFLASALEGVEGLDKYANYIEENDRANNREFVFNLFYTFIFVLCHKRMYRVDPRSNFLLYLSVIAVILNFTGFMTPFIKRVAIFFSIFNIPLAAIWIKSFSSYTRAIAFIFIIGFYFSRLIVINYVLKQGHMIPYNTKSTYHSQYLSQYENPFSDSDCCRWWSRACATKPPTQSAERTV